MDVNTLELCRDNYLSSEAFENAIKTAIFLLMDAGYIMTVRLDNKDFGIVCIDYNYKDQSLGAHYPYWLSPEEHESIIWDNEREEK